MKFVSKSQLKGYSNISIVEDIESMVTPCNYYTPNEPDLGAAIQAIFEVLSSEQKIKVAKSLGYLPYADYVAYKRVKEFVKQIRELLDEYVTVDFRKDKVLISDNDEELKNFSKLEELPEIEKLDNSNYDDDICPMTGHNFGGPEYSFTLKDSDFKCLVERLLKVGVDLEF